MCDVLSDPMTDERKELIEEVFGWSDRDILNLACDGAPAKIIDTIKGLRDAVRAFQERHQADVHWVRGQGARCKSLESENLTYSRDLAAIAKMRAGKLLLKGKPFIVIANDEPYYLTVYRMIREHEQAKGSWTEECERCYLAAVAESEAPNGR